MFFTTICAKRTRPQWHTLVDKYIVVEKDKVEEAFRERKNLTLICQDGEIAEISEKFNFKYELLQKMNACTVYNVEFNN